ncbi:MAG: nucleotidyl transferase AbiEii/AbiGii toxin family protein [Planctomycetia bacterium]|nr:nucleotidyl transferase AbiEii/AbiGii toxin family protein [Planctomycetia bacterium]
MNFVHDESGFASLLTQVADQTGIAPALVEKDYWITHAIWALHETGLDLWLKGGTSLSKGFGIIERFSEDLDLMVERGRVAALPDVSSWTSLNQGPVKQRQAFYHALAEAFALPAVPAERDLTREDKYARGADYLGRYPGVFAANLPSAMSPSVRYEVGRARVVPFFERPVTSFVHQHLDRVGMIGEFIDNRPLAVRCVHPLVTLLEKLDALSRRYGRETIEADGFVRHYEDAARIVRAIDTLPPSEIPARALANDMLAQNDVAALPSADDPSLVLDNPAKRAAVAQAYARIAPMFWGPRLPLDEACRTLREWVAASLGG